MSDYTDIPSAAVERAEMMEDILIERATGGSGDNDTYKTLRQAFMADHTICALLPEFVTENRNLDMFWSFITNESLCYEERHRIVSKAFTPLIESS